MNENFLNVAIGIGVITIFLFLLELLASKEIVRKETARNLLHAIAGMTVTAFVALIDDFLLLLVTGIIVAIILFGIVRYDFFPRINNKARKSWGIFYFAVAFLILVLTAGTSYRWIISVSFLITAVADPLAAYAGTNFTKSYYRLTSDKKSLLGSTVFFTTSLFILLLLLALLLMDSPEAEFIQAVIPLKPVLTESPFYYAAAMVSIALLLTIAEALSSKGSDNLSVPLSAAFLLYYLFVYAPGSGLQLLLPAMLFGVVIALLSYRLGFLSKDGAAATFLLASLIFGTGGWKWTVPILLFFIVSSVLSLLRKKRNPSIEERFDKTGKRDAFQVMANGGLPALLIITYIVSAGTTLFGAGLQELIYPLYVLSIAVVCADTWATEIGTMSKAPTYNIIGLKPLEQGRSGGISVPGSAGAFAGATVIALSAYFWINDITVIFLILFFGFAGSFVDSLLGAALQAQYRCAACNLITERTIHCNMNTIPYSGWEKLTNDAVNFSAAFITVVALWLVLIGLSIFYQQNTVFSL